MIIWQGLGFLAILIPGIFFVTAEAILGKDFFGPQMYGNEIIILISAIVVWFIGTKLNSKPGKVLIDPVTNQKVVLKPKHTMFWIPMHWFGIIFGVIALLSFLQHFH